MKQEDENQEPVTLSMKMLFFQDMKQEDENQEPVTLSVKMPFFKI